MNELLLGFGAPGVVALWVAVSAAVLWWLAVQVGRRSPVTIPTYLVVFSFLLPVLLQYPFTFSPINAAATGVAAFAAYTAFVDRAFLITLAGFAAGGVGFALSSKRARPYAPVSFITRGLSAWSSPVLLWASSLLVAVLLLILVAAGLIGPEGMRSYALTRPLLRPVYSILATVLPVLIALALLIASHRRKGSLWALALVASVPAVLTGSRGVAFGGLMAYVQTILTERSLRQEVRAKHVLLLIPAAAVVLFFVFYLGNVRHGQYNPLITAAGFGAGMVYGNNFSDLRDFAWVLAYWDGTWFGGRTQLAGLLGFIPSFLWSFRVEWGFGRVTTEMTGIVEGRELANQHAGLRPGLFGELYFNFGLAGVLLGGLVLGHVTARLHAATRDAIDGLPPVRARLAVLAAVTALTLLGHFYISSGFFSVYVLLGVVAALRTVKGIIRAAASGAARSGEPAAL